MSDEADFSPEAWDKAIVLLVTNEEWDAIQKLLDAPARDLPRLRDLFSRPTVFEEGS